MSTEYITSESEYDTEEEKKKSANATEKANSNKSKTKSKHRKQKFRQEWLANENFKFWLKKMGDFSAKCTICNKELSTEISVIKSHAKSDKHQQKYSGIVFTKHFNFYYSFFISFKV